jgi:nucleoside-diphosphate-sugar epimerase
MAECNDTIIVTGSTGFIGSALIKKFASRFALVGFDRVTTHRPQPTVDCIYIDLTSEDSIAAGLQRVRTTYGSRIASVIHLAAYFDLTGAPNSLYDEITVRGTEKLLHTLQSFDVEQLIFASSMLAHKAGGLGDVINEDSPLQTDLPYRASKIEAERLIHEQHGPIPVVYIRPAGVYDGLCHNAFLANQIARIYERDLTGHVYPGNLHTGQSFLHLEDLLDAIARLIERRSALAPEGALLLGEPEVIGYGDLQAEIGRLLHGESWETREIPKALAKAGTWVQQDLLREDSYIRPWMIDIADDHYAIDISRARHLLDWEPAHSLRGALPQMIEALKADPAGWYQANKLNAARVAGEEAETRKRSDALHTNHEKMESGPMVDMAGMSPRMLWAHFSALTLGIWLLTSPLQFARSSSGPRGARHHAGARTVGAGSTQCTYGMERHHIGFAACALWLACTVAAFFLGAMGFDGRRSLASVRPPFLLDDERRRHYERHDHRLAGNRLLGARSDDAGHEPGRNDGSQHRSAWLDLFAVILAATSSDDRARLLRLSHRALSYRLPAGADKRRLGPVLLRR